jgi:hypothetical protein
LIIDVVESGWGFSGQWKFVFIFLHLNGDPVHVVNVEKPSVVIVLAAGSVASLKETSAASSKNKVFP